MDKNKVAGSGRPYYSEGMSPVAADLLDEIERYIERTAMAPTAFGLAAIGDKNFVRQLRAGRDPHASTIDRVRDYMRMNRKRGKK